LEEPALRDQVGGTTLEEPSWNTGRDLHRVCKVVSLMQAELYIGIVRWSFSCMPGIYIGFVRWSLSRMAGIYIGFVRWSLSCMAEIYIGFVR
jgi:hypothetical protein